MYKNDQHHTMLSLIELITAKKVSFFLRREEKKNEN